MNPAALLWDARRARRGGPATIAARQRDRLATIVDHARRSSPFYRHLYADLPDRVTDPELLPVVNKQTLMAHFDQWVTDPALTEKKARAVVDDPARIGERLLGRYVLTTTSGTTGSHGIFVQDDQALAVAAAMMGRMLGSQLTARAAVSILNHRGRLALIVPTGGHFATTTAAARMTTNPRLAKIIGVFSVHDPLPELVENLNRFQPAILAPYATVGAMLATEAEAGRLHIDPALVILAAEGLRPAEYDRIGTAFNARVSTSYAANEVPFLSASCSQRWLHINADWVIVEPVDADHQPVPAGETSHTVLITNLANRIQPILRYDLGDSILARPNPCECGNPLPAIRVQGRAADLLTFTRPDGTPVTLSPLALATLVERTPGIERFQIVQTAPTTLRIRLQPAAGHRADQLTATVNNSIYDLLARHHLTHIAVEQASEPPHQTAGGKFRQVIPLTSRGERHQTSRPDLG